MERKASARWNGDLKQGKGIMSTESGTLKDTPYAFSSRFESGTGTNPEELIGAALAGCFSMALSASLANAGHHPEQVSTEAKVSLEKVGDKTTITKIHLETTGRVGGVDEAKFNDFVEQTREGCIISRALTAEITVKARLLQETSA
jgi:lipoyl-dependent peroxiredoxin